ncbi:MAG: hypothetical protein ACK5NU_14435 [Fusobacterium ulcerans]|uniref:hypothetical protein n=1 Tax=Fusobacterium ulcerans TaxID=861 RepID=UPI003A8A141D
MVNIKEVVHNSKERFLEVQPNGAGLYIGMQAYEAIKNESEYTDSMKTIIPKMELLTGTLAGKEFTVTTGIVEVMAAPKNVVVALFDKSELAGLATAENFKGMANPNLVEIVKVTATTASSITLANEPVNSAFINAVLLENDGYIDVAQITDFSSTEQQAEISTNNKHSNGYESAIGGLKTSSIDGIQGYYHPDFPSVATINFAFDGEYTIKARHGALKQKNTPYIEGVYKVAEFTHSGTLDGGSALSYTASLKLQSEMIEKKVFQ